MRVILEVEERDGHDDALLCAWLRAFGCRALIMALCSSGDGCSILGF